MKFVYIYIYIYIRECVRVCAFKFLQPYNKRNHFFFLGRISKKYIYIYIYIYHHHHHVLRPARISLTLLSTSPYHSLPLAGLQGYIPYHHIAAVCMFELVVLLLIGHMRGPQEYITYELVLASPAVSGLSGSSSLDSFRDRW